MDDHNLSGVCLQAGHLTKKNKKCPLYKEEEPEIMAPWLPDLNLPEPPMQVSALAPTPILTPSLLDGHFLLHACLRLCLRIGARMMMPSCIIV